MSLVNFYPLTVDWPAGTYEGYADFFHSDCGCDWMTWECINQCIHAWGLDVNVPYMCSRFPDVVECIAKGGNITVS